MAKELTITSQNAKAAASTFWQWVKEALAGGAVTVEVRRPSKTREQEKHYHALIQEICAHAIHPDEGRFAPKPADIVRHLVGDTGSLAQRAWTKVLDAIERVGMCERLAV